MRAVGGSRNGKIEKTRLVGIGMMLVGILSITFAVAGVSGAGTSAASPAHHVCAIDGGGYSSTTGQLAGAINKGCNEPTTTMKHGCGCSTTTTIVAPTSTTSHCTCSTTTSTSTTSTSTTTSTSMPTTTSTSASTTTSTTMPVTTSSEVEGETSTLPTVPGNIATTTGKPTISVEGVTSTLPGITVEPTSGQLPFTGGSPFPLAVTGVVLLATGAGLARRKRNLD